MHEFRMHSILRKYTARQLSKVGILQDTDGFWNYRNDLDIIYNSLGGLASISRESMCKTSNSRQQLHSVR